MTSLENNKLPQKMMKISKYVFWDLMAKKFFIVH